MQPNCQPRPAGAVPIPPPPAARIALERRYFAPGRVTRVAELPMCHPGKSNASESRKWLWAILVHAIVELSWRAVPGIGNRKVPLCGPLMWVRLPPGAGTSSFTCWQTHAGLLPPASSGEILRRALCITSSAPPRALTSGDPSPAGLAGRKSACPTSCRYSSA